MISEALGELGLQAQAWFGTTHSRLLSSREQAPWDFMGWDGTYWWHIDCKHTENGNRLIVPEYQWPPKSELFVSIVGPVGSFAVRGFAYANMLVWDENLPQPAYTCESGELLDWTRMYVNYRLPSPADALMGVYLR